MVRENNWLEFVQICYALKLLVHKDRRMMDLATVFVQAYFETFIITPVLKCSLFCYIKVSVHVHMKFKAITVEGYSNC